MRDSQSINAQPIIAEHVVGTSIAHPFPSKLFIFHDSVSPVHGVGKLGKVEGNWKKSEGYILLGLQRNKFIQTNDGV